MARMYWIVLGDCEAILGWLGLNELVENGMIGEE